MKKNYLLAVLVLLFFSCKKTNKPSSNPTTVGTVAESTETNNGITYRLFIVSGQSSYKGIVVMGSGNDENNPSPGALNGAAETQFCEKAASNGYVAAIVQYSKTPGVADWNGSALTIAGDYDKCIQSLATLYHTDKSKSVAVSYTHLRAHETDSY